MDVQAHSISKSYGEAGARSRVLDNVNLAINSGEICVLLGPSGSGKTTLLNIIGGIETPDGGQILVGGTDIAGASERKLLKYRRDNLGYIFQSYNLIANLTARENIEVGAYLSKNPLDFDELIGILGMREHLQKLPAQLSGGQQQRTSIGRAMVKNPGLLLCDEPTGALDYQTSKDILTLIRDVSRKYGTTVIMVTHNRDQAAMADRIIELRDGAVVSDETNSAVDPQDLTW